MHTLRLLVDLVLRRAAEDNLCVVTDNDPAETAEPRLIFIPE